MSQKYYSPESKGFYDSEINQGSLPADVVKITDDHHRSLLAANAMGQIIDTGPDGLPAAKDNAANVEVSRRRARDSMLTETDWLVNRHRDEVDSETSTTLSSDQYRSLQEWRATLRNMTKHPDWPRVSFPPRPQGV